MPQRRNDPLPKAEAEWGVEEWKLANEILTKQFRKLREEMRIALQLMGKAQAHLACAVE